MTRIMRLLAVCAVLLGLSASAIPTRADQNDGVFSASASVDYPTPRQFTTEVVRVNVSWDQAGLQPVAGVTVCTVWHYRTTDTAPGCVATDDNGNAAISHYISGATRGYTVAIDVTVDLGDGPINIDGTAFTPA